MTLTYVQKTGPAFAPAYANDAVVSPTGKYVIVAAASGNINIYIRDDATGNYPTSTSPIGAGAVNTRCVAWGANDDWFVIGASQGWCYYATRDAGTDVFRYQSGFNTGHTNVLGVSIKPGDETVWATTGGDSNVKFWSVIRGTSHTLRSTHALGGIGEDVQFSPDGTWAAAAASTSNVKIYSVSGYTATLHQTLTGAQNSHIDWHPDGDHIAGGVSGSGTGYKVIKKDGTTFSVLADPFEGGMQAWEVSAAVYITGGLYLHVQGKVSTQWKVYERVGDAYNDVTANVVGYTGIATNDGRSAVNGSLMALGGTGSAYAIYVTPPLPTSGETVESEAILSAFTAEAEVSLFNNVNSAASISGFTSDGEVFVATGGFGELIVPKFVAEVLVAASEEDVITLQPIIMAPASAFTSTIDPIISVENDPAPFTYGFLEFPSFTMDAFVRHPLEVRTSNLVLSGFTSDGLIEWAIVPEPIELSLLPFTLDGEVSIRDGQIYADAILEGFTSNGEVTVPWGLRGDISLSAFTTTAYARFGYDASSEAILSGYLGDGLVFMPISADGEGTLAAFVMDAELLKDSRSIDSELLLNAFTADGEGTVDFGGISEIILPGFTADGLLDVPFRIRSEMYLKGFEAEVLIDRPTMVDANFSFHKFVADAHVSTPLENTAQLKLQAFEMSAEVAFLLTVEGEGVLNGFILDGGVRNDPKKVTGILTVPAFTGEGEAKFLYKITSEMKLSRFLSEGETASMISVTSEMYVEKFTTAATLRAAMFRREIRVVVDTFS